MAVAAEAADRRDYNMEAQFLANARARANQIKLHPDKIPNWMRGFYDEFKPEVKHDQHQSQEYEVVRAAVDYDYRPSEAHEDYERTHHGRGFATLAPLHESYERVPHYEEHH